MPSMLFAAIRLLHSYRRRLETGVTPRPEVQSFSGTPAHVYRGRLEAASTLIMVPGLHPHGIQDLRFRALAATFADAGFLVIAADITQFRAFEISPAVLPVLDAIVEGVSGEIPERERQRLGLMGISFAAGPVFATAAKKKIDFVVLVGGYCDLSQILESAFSATEAWGRMIFALNHLHNLFGDEADEIREALLLQLNLEEAAFENKRSALSPEAAKTVQEIIFGLSSELLARFLQVMKNDPAISNDLSPATYLKDLDPSVRLYLLHGSADPLVPSQQTDELAKRFLETGHPHVIKLISKVLTHADTTATSKVIETYKLLSWISKLLREHQPA